MQNDLLSKWIGASTALGIRDCGSNTFDAGVHIHRSSTLPKMVLDIDLDTRIYSSKVIGYAARDYNGRTALLEVNSDGLSKTLLGSPRNI